MIGFQPELQPDALQQDEGMETKHLDKKQLYDSLSHIYFLPPYMSKGVTREYLLGIHKEKYYRVRIMEYKHFEVDLAPEMTRRIGVVNNAILVRKLNILLHATDRKPLGFEEWDPPEQVD